MSERSFKDLTDAEYDELTRQAQARTLAMTPEQRAARMADVTAADFEVIPEGDENKPRYRTENA